MCYLFSEHIPVLGIYFDTETVYYIASKKTAKRDPTLYIYQSFYATGGLQVSNMRFEIALVKTATFRRRLHIIYTFVLSVV